MDDKPLMCCRFFLALTATALCALPTARGTEAWSLVKAGMNRVDTTAVLGAPLFKNVARGFECWIYDGGAEVVCYRGMVVAWTAPAGFGSTAGRQLDLRIFQKPTEPPAPVFRRKEVELEPDLELTPIRQMRLPR